MGATGSAKQGFALGATGSANEDSDLGSQDNATSQGSAVLGATRIANEDPDLGSQDGTASQGSAMGATGSAKLRPAVSTKRGKGFAQDGTANQSSALGATASANEDFVLGAKGGVWGEPGSKRLRGKECHISSPHKEMIKHTRTTKPEAAPGDAVLDHAMAQERDEDLSMAELVKMLQMAAGDEDYDYVQYLIRRAERAKTKTEESKELTAAVVEALRSDQKLLMLFQEAGRRIRYLADVWAMAEELDAAAEEAEEAGQPALSAELTKMADKQLSELDSGHKYTTFADRPDQWKMLQALDYEHRVILPPGSAPAKQGSGPGVYVLASQGSALGVDGAANPGSALGVPAADRPFALWAPRAPQGRGMNVYYMCRAKRRKNCTCGN